MTSNDSQNDSLNIAQNEPAKAPQLDAAPATMAAMPEPVVEKSPSGSDALADSSTVKPEKKARAPRKAKAATKAPLPSESPAAPQEAPPDSILAQDPIPASSPSPASAPKQTPAMIEAPMPTFEQVQKAEAKAWRLQFQDECPEQAERARQISEGRRLAQAEGFAPLKHVDERELQIRTGQSLAAQESRQARAPSPRPAAQKNNDSKDARPAGAKKSRNRNRNRKNRPASPPQGA